MGLVEKIKLAASVNVIETLLEEGKTYTAASPKTQRRWKYVAERRIKEIVLQREQKSSVEEKLESALPPRKSKSRKS